MMNISYKNQLHYLWQFLILSVLIIWSLPLFAVESEVRRNDPSYWIPDTINFEFGFDRFRVNFSNEYPDASYIKNLIESWNWSSGPKLVTAKEACVYKDVSHNCTVSLTQGGMSRNGHNQIHFQWWPDDFPDWLAATKAQSVQGLAYITNLGEAPVYDDVDILMNNRDIDWITRDLIDYW